MGMGNELADFEEQEDDYPPSMELAQTEVREVSLHKEVDEFADVGLPTHPTGSDEYFETTPGDTSYVFDHTTRDILPANSMRSPNDSDDDDCMP